MDEELRFYTSTCNLLQDVYPCIYTIIIKLYIFQPYLCVYISTRVYCINIDVLKMTSYSESGTRCGSHGNYPVYVDYWGSTVSPIACQLAAIGSLLTLTPLALHILTVPLYPVINMHRVKCNNCMCTEHKAYSFSSLCVRADKEGMLHMCIRVAICAWLYRCVVVRKVWAWRHWMDLECGFCRGRHYVVVCASAHICLH